MPQAWAFSQYVLLRRNEEAYNWSMAMRASFHAETKTFKEFLEALRADNGD